MAESINSQPKKIVSVTFAVIFGIGIIFVAWRSNVQTSSPLLSKTPSGALGVLPSKYSYATLGFRSGRTGSKIVATTTTDFIAQQLVLNYTLAQKNTATTTFVNPDPQALAEDLANKALSDPTMKRYTEKDLVVIKDSSKLATDKYWKEVLGALATLSKENKVNELFVIASALDTKDPAKLAPLSVSLTADQKFLTTILAIQVPSSLVKADLLLVQGYGAITSGIADVQQVLGDPARGLRGLGKYEYGISLFSQISSVMPLK